MDAITEADIADANDERLAQLAQLARYGSMALIGVGALGALAWLWYVVRAQMNLGPGIVFSLDGSGDAFSLTERLDLLASSTTLLVQSALAAGLGLLGLLWSSRIGAAMGVSLHGVAVGDPVPDLDDE